jgi:hypothetical protein
LNQYSVILGKVIVNQIQTTKGGDRMTDTERLKLWIDKSGYKRSFIAAHLGMVVPTLQRKIENASEFTISEVDSLCKLLGINDLEEKERVFFCPKK